MCQKFINVNFWFKKIGDLSFHSKWVLWNFSSLLWNFSRLLWNFFGLLWNIWCDGCVLRKVYCPGLNLFAFLIFSTVILNWTYVNSDFLIKSLFFRVNGNRWIFCLGEIRQYRWGITVWEVISIFVKLVELKFTFCSRYLSIMWLSHVTLFKKFLNYYHGIMELRM